MKRPDFVHFTFLIMKISLRFIQSAAFMLALAFGVLLSSSAMSRTFEIAGSKNISLTSPSNSWTTVQINNLTSSQLLLSVTIENDGSLLDIYPKDQLRLIDSAGLNGGYVYISYKGGNATVINARIILFDGVATRDTIFVNAQDDRFNDPNHPFDVFPTDRVETIAPNVYSFDHNKSETTIGFEVDNFTVAELSMASFLFNTSANFSLDKSSFTIAASGGYLSKANFTLTYHKSGNPTDTAHLVVMSTSPMVHADTLTIIGQDSAFESIPYISADTPIFANQALGTKECKDMTIHNPNSYPINVTSAKISVYGGGSFTPTSLSTPFVIDANSDHTVNVCYTSPAHLNDETVFQLQLDYNNGNGTSNQAYFAAIGTTATCQILSPKDILNIEPALPGGYTDATFTLTNNTSESMTLTNVTFASGTKSEYFSLASPVLPSAIGAHSTENLTVHFAPTQMINGQCIAHLGFSFTGTSDTGCNSLEYMVVSTTLDPNDTDMIALFPSQKQSLPIKSGTDKITKTFTFWNNSGAAVKVMSASITDGTHFRIVSTDPASLPATIQAGGRFSIDVEFDAGGGGFYSDELIIVTDHALVSQSFHLQAIRTGTADVRQDGQAEPALMISPNPSHGDVAITVTNATVRSLSIYDELGNLVAENTNAAEWVWGATNATGIAVGDGTYFIRAEGIGQDGKRFVSTQKLLLRK
jgi:hypothetical protein